MNVRTLPFELQQRAIVELNEDPRRIAQYFEDFRSWLKYQPHLKFKDDNQFLLAILRVCKFSLEKSKKKIELYYTMKNFSPEFFIDRDPFKKSIQSMLSAKTVIIRISTSSVIGCVSWRYIENMRISLCDVAQLGFMYLDILINESDAFIINKIILVVDFKDVPLKACFKWDINLLKKMLMFTKAYCVRIHSIIAINVSSTIQKIYDVLKIIFDKKLQSKIFLFNEKHSYKLFELVPRDLLPEEFEGTAGNGSKAVAEWKIKVESYKEWFKEDEKYKTYEELRVGNPVTYSEIFGAEGSFKKLDFD